MTYFEKKRKRREMFFAPLVRFLRKIERKLVEYQRNNPKIITETKIHKIVQKAFRKLCKREFLQYRTEKMFVSATFNGYSGQTIFDPLVFARMIANCAPSPYYWAVKDYLQNDIAQMYKLCICANVPHVKTKFRLVCEIARMEPGHRTYRDGIEIVPQ